MKKDYKTIKLFGVIGDTVRLKENVLMENNEILTQGSIFEVLDIIEFGFDLKNFDNGEFYRFLNSEMFKYFEKIEQK